MVELGVLPASGLFASFPFFFFPSFSIILLYSSSVLLYLSGLSAAIEWLNQAQSRQRWTRDMFGFRVTKRFGTEVGRAVTCAYIMAIFVHPCIDI